MKPLALVIENDAGTRKLLDVLLSRFGFEVDLVATGADALLVLEQVRYDVLFIDLLIPGVSGHDILVWLARERPEMLAHTVVLSSASPARLEAVRDEFSPAHVIRKPFELGEVIESAQSASANRAPRIPTAAELFCRHSVRAGAKGGVIVRKAGKRVEPLLWFGYKPEMVADFFPADLDESYPLCIAIRNAAPVWAASIPRAMQDYPRLAPILMRNESRALAAVPLLHGGVVIGAAGWSFREPRLFSEVEQQLLTAIAALVVEALPSTDNQSTVRAEA